ncbi:Phosphoprotein phosphatase [Bertholletia excelsa]
MEATSFYIPKPNKLKPQGEDAHFICQHRQIFGIADGVGGWARKGIDAGEYARELMANSVTAVHRQPQEEVDPKVILKEAYLNTEARGSSTACILTLNGHILHAVNVGDSGFILIRDGKVAYKSPTQQHGFNCPYQLGNTKDDPSVAEELKISVIPGDIVVAGTDGLFDNLHDWEIGIIVRLFLGTTKPSNKLAWKIAQEACERSGKKFALTPFAMASSKAGRQFMGGKIDDITVVVAFILRGQESAKEEKEEDPR